MKILQINKFYFLQGGAERYLFDLSKLLEKRGHKVVPFAMEHPKNRQSEWSKYFPSYVETSKPGLSLAKLKTIPRMLYSWEAKSKLEELIKKVKPDVAHIHNIYHHLSPSILPVLKKAGIPVVMTVHDYKLICPNYILYTENSPCERCLEHRYYNAIKHRCLKNSYLASSLAAFEMYFHKILKIYEKNVDLFIAPSNFVKEKLVKFGLKEDKIFVLPHFIDTDSIQPEFGQGEGYFLYIGRLKKEKGADVLLSALAHLNKINLKIIGVGEEEENLKQLAGKYPLNNVDFLGSKNKEETAGIFQKARAVIVPSRVWETFGFSALEGMAFGKPVIASKMGALPEIVEDKKTGLLFESENVRDLTQKIKFVIDNPQQAEAFGERGREKAEKSFSPEKHYQELLKIYEQAKKQ